jgi:hypothetical protein
MNERGIEMIDAVQGPPRWRGPDVLLRNRRSEACHGPRSSTIRSAGTGLVGSGARYFPGAQVPVDGGLSATGGQPRSEV